MEVSVLFDDGCLGSASHVTGDLWQVLAGEGVLRWVIGSGLRRHRTKDRLPGFKTLSWPHTCLWSGMGESMRQGVYGTM